MFLPNASSSLCTAASTSEFVHGTSAVCLASLVLCTPSLLRSTDSAVQPIATIVCGFMAALSAQLDPELCTLSIVLPVAVMVFGTGMRITVGIFEVACGAFALFAPLYSVARLRHALAYSNAQTRQWGTLGTGRRPPTVGRSR